MSFLLPIQLFKILADETRLGIVLLLSETGRVMRLRSLHCSRPIAAQDLPPPGIAA